VGDTTSKKILKNREKGGRDEKRRERIAHEMIRVSKANLGKRRSKVTSKTVEALKS